MSTTPVSLTSATSSSADPTTTSADSGNIANEDVFLQLLVAQLKYQDPSQPADGTEFVSELAQFTDVSNTTSMSTDLGSILQLMQGTAATQGTSTTGSASPNATPASSGTTNQTANS